MTIRKPALNRAATLSFPLFGLILAFVAEASVPPLELNQDATGKINAKLNQPPKGQKVPKIQDQELVRLVDEAVATLENKLSVDKSGIKVLEAKRVTWRDSSLGCPKPDYSYLQVLTNGVQIKLLQDGINYSFHSADGQPLFLCENPDNNAALPYEETDT